MVKYIKVNNEKLPVSVSYHCISKFEHETGKGLADLGDEKLSLYEPIFFYALEAGFKAEKKIFDIKREEVTYMLDDCWLDFLKLINEFFTEVATHNEKKQK